MHEVLRQVAEALLEWNGCHRRTTQRDERHRRPAEFLGIARPTLVRMLERGDVPMEQPGQHRFVRLRDLVDYQERERKTRRAALDKMARDGDADGLYQATDGPPRRTR